MFARNLCSFALVVLATTACSTVKSRLFELPDLPGGEDISYAYDINGNGNIVVGESFSALSSVHGEGVRWKKSGATWIAQGLGLPVTPAGGLNSPCLGIDRDGSAYAGRVSFGAPTSPAIDTLAYSWKPSGGFAMLPLLPGDIEAQGSSVTEGAVHIVGWGSAFLGYAHTFALYWQRSGPSWIVKRIDSNLEGQANRIDASGRFAFGWARSPTSGEAAKKGIAHEAVCWTRTGATWHAEWLGTLPGNELYSQVNGISRSNAKFVAGFCGDPSLHCEPVLWRMNNGHLVNVTDLGLLPGKTSGGANAVSENGKRVVGSCFDDTSSDSFVWEPGTGMRSIRAMLLTAGVSAVVDWDLTAATGISEDGHVVCGYGTHHVGGVDIERAWVATLP